MIEDLIIMSEHMILTIRKLLASTEQQIIDMLLSSCHQCVMIHSLATRSESEPGLHV